MMTSDHQMKIRLPGELKDAIEAAAKAANRSMTAEIILRLEESYAGRGDDRECREAVLRLEGVVSAYERVLGLALKEIDLNRMLEDPEFAEAGPAGTKISMEVHPLVKAILETFAAARGVTLEQHFHEIVTGEAQKALQMNKGQKPGP